MGMRRAVTRSRPSPRACRRFILCAWAVCLLAGANAQSQLPQADLERADTAVRDAFAFLYALPRDTAAAEMGSWVIDSDETTLPGQSRGEWRIVITRLSDTGDGLELNEMAGRGGTTAAQLAESMAAMQRLESKISRAEADASLEITVRLNAEVDASGVAFDAPRSAAAVRGAQVSMRIDGGWMHALDRELDVAYERWSPATLVAGFGSFSSIDVQQISPAEPVARVAARIGSPAPSGAAIHAIGVVVQGNDAMIERVARETRWAALAALVN